MFKSNTSTNLCALAMLILMAGILIYSALFDSATTDEMAHIPAGYSYVKYGDMRLNPEHPPLVKDLAGIPLLFQKLNFPLDSDAWQKYVNGQWDAGSQFLYYSGNDADKIIFWARLGPIFLTLLLGLFIFLIAKEYINPRWALIALFLYAFSPTVLAHGHYVTTDIGAAFGIITGLFFFLKFLKRPRILSFIWCAVFLAIALLLKFSTIILIPFIIFIAFIWIILNSNNSRHFFILLGKWATRFVLLGAIVLFLVWLAYFIQIQNYPQQKQISDTQYILQGYKNNFFKKTTMYLTQNPGLRPLGQYMLGATMVLQRSAGGNTTYFLGEVNNTGWWYYFPIIFLIKEPLSSLILMTIALFLLLALLWDWFKGFKYHLPYIKEEIKESIEWFAIFLFIIGWWLIAINSTLNIGVRHILPAILLMQIFSLKIISYWIRPLPENGIDSVPVLLKRAKIWLSNMTKKSLIGLLLALYLIETILFFPFYIAYFNESIGAANGYKYVVDSNLDWGQDLKRLAYWVKQNNIEKIYVDYFGGGNPRYYLGDKYEQWWGKKNPADLKPGDYLAVSATFLQSGRGKPTKGFSQPTDFYKWLDDYEPFARIGYSIFVYQISRNSTGL